MQRVLYEKDLDNELFVVGRLLNRIYKLEACPRDVHTYGFYSIHVPILDYNGYLPFYYNNTKNYYRRFLDKDDIPSCKYDEYILVYKKLDVLDWNGDDNDCI